MFLCVSKRKNDCRKGIKLSFQIEIALCRDEWRMWHAVYLCLYVCILRQVLVSLHLEDTRARMLNSNVAAVLLLLLLLLLWLHFQFSQFPRRICMSWDVEVNGDCRLKNGDGRLWDRRLIIIELTTGLTKSNSNNSSCCRWACNAAAAVDLNQCCCCFCCCCCRVSCRNS